MRTSFQPSLTQGSVVNNSQIIDKTKSVIQSGNFLIFSLFIIESIDSRTLDHPFHLYVRSMTYFTFPGTTVVRHQFSYPKPMPRKSVGDFIDFKFSTVVVYNRSDTSVVILRVGNGHLIFYRVEETFQ